MPVTLTYIHQDEQNPDSPVIRRELWRGDRRLAHTVEYSELSTYVIVDRDAKRSRAFHLSGSVTRFLKELKAEFESEESHE